MVRKNLLGIFLGSLAGIAVGVSGALAQDFPTKPIRVIVAAAAGGSPDINARLIGAQLERQLGQPVVIENRPGSNGIIALQALARSAPDGYTLAYMSTPHSVNPSVYMNLPFDTQKDFDPVALTGITEGYLLLAHPSLPANNLRELEEYAKTNRVRYASGGVGSHLHLGGELLKIAIDGQLQHVPYKGVGEMIPALLAGDVHIMFTSPNAVLQYIRNGDFKVLAVVADQPLSSLPDAPLSKDTLPDFTLDGWHGWLAPAGVPSEILDKLNLEIRRAIRVPELETAIREGGLIPSDFDPAQTREFLNNQEVRWATAVEAAGIEPQ